jgi:hypothetical protein
MWAYVQQTKRGTEAVLHHHMSANVMMLWVVIFGPISHKLDIYSGGFQSGFPPLLW